MKLVTGSYPPWYRLPASYPQQIGRFITRWAYLEWRLKQSAYKILDIGPKQGRLAVQEPRIKNYITMIEQLLRASKIHLSTDFKTLKTGLENLEIKRNAVIHGIWIKHPNFQTPVLQSTKGTWPKKRRTPGESRKIQPEGIPVSADHIRQWVRSVDDANRLITIFEKELDHALQASRKKSR